MAGFRFLVIRLFVNSVIRDKKIRVNPPNLCHPRSYRKLRLRLKTKAY